MKRLTVSAIVLAAACAGLASPADAQVRTTPPGKLFFEGDIVKHNLDTGSRVRSACCRAGTSAERPSRGACACSSPTAPLPTTRYLKSVVVEMGSGQKLPRDYGPHGNPPTDFFWAYSWTIPPKHPDRIAGLQGQSPRCRTAAW